MKRKIEGRDVLDGVPQTVVVDASLINAKLRGSACGHPSMYQRGLSGCIVVLPGRRRRHCGTSYSEIEDERERQSAERDQAYAIAVSEFPLPHDWPGTILVRENGSERKVY